MSWSPPPRAPWVEKLAVVGHSLGDDGRSIVSLDPDQLLAAATAATGLDDWGDDWFLGPYRTLLASLEDEAALHLPGRLRARGGAGPHPGQPPAAGGPVGPRAAVLAGPVDEPVFVTGLGRSGTTLLHELLALDPEVRSPGCGS